MALQAFEIAMTKHGKNRETESRTARSIEETNHHKYELRSWDLSQPLIRLERCGNMINRSSYVRYVSIRRSA